MADRRMIHRKVVESDDFYNLPASAQALYLHLTIAGDEDGFVNCANAIAMRFKTGKADLKELVKARFLLQFGEVYVIKHWRIANSLKNDRKKAPAYPNLAAKIWICANRAYTDHPVEGCLTLLETKTGVVLDSKLDSGMDSKRIPDGFQNGFPTEKNRIRTEPKRTEPTEAVESTGAPGADFQRLWSEYPETRLGNRSKAEEEFRVEICSPEDFDKAMANLELWKKSEQWNKDGGRYVPYLDNWLSKGIWMTEPPDAHLYKPRELDEDELAAIRRMMEEDW